MEKVEPRKEDEPWAEGLYIYDIKNQTTVAAIDHPPMNALDVPTKEALATVFRELDDSIRAI